MEAMRKAIIVGANINDQKYFAYSMEELGNLADACHMEVVGELTQNLERVNPSHYIGSGKVEELADLVKKLEADAVIFNDELSPSQIRNLEEAVQSTILDRTILILDIFAERARTKEAQLQVEVAQLQYMLPRLVGLRQSLSRQGGGAGSSFRNRGSGETKLELDRRKIEDKIAALNKELEKLKDQRKIQRKQRKKNEVPVVCLVGYTNTGKSTLMNVMVEHYSPAPEKLVLAQNMLFATLETSVRSIELPDRKTFLLTDTVGFVSQLPHHLVKAFRSTLEEVAEADLLIHVVDYSNPEFLQQIAVTEQTLEELGASHIPMIYAYNKSDLTDSVWPKVEGNAVYLSAVRQSGVEELLGLVRGQIFQDYVRCEMLIPFDQGRLIAYFNEHAHIHSTSYEENGTLLSLECKSSDYEKYKQLVVL